MCAAFFSSKFKRRTKKKQQRQRNNVISSSLYFVVFLGWDVRHLEHDVIYWDIVVVTTLDIVQKEAYDALIEQRSTINRIPLGVDYLVVTDPGKIGRSYYVIFIVIVLLLLLLLQRKRRYSHMSMLSNSA